MYRAFATFERIIETRDGATYASDDCGHLFRLNEKQQEWEYHSRLPDFVEPYSGKAIAHYPAEK